MSRLEQHRSIPRDFRLKLEGETAGSEFPGVTFGLNDDLDRNMISWSGMFCFATGHCIAFNLTVPEEYPNVPPEISFSDEYLSKTREDYEDEMGKYVESIHRMCDPDTLRFPQEIIEWDKGMFIGEWLLKVKTKMFGR